MRMTTSIATEKKWKQYRQMRLLNWASFAVAAACIFLGSGTAIVLSLVVWGALSFAAAFWPCPFCGGRVGYIPLGPFVMVWPFGGWCTTCGRRLFRHG